MNKRLLLSLAATAVFGLVAGNAATASAHPTYTQACSGCHGSSTSVKVSVVQTANNGTSATYNVTVTGGSGSAGWTVLEGTTRKAYASNASSAFTVPVGHTYRVWGVKTSTGANSISLAPVAPAPTVTPTGTVTIKRSVASVYLPKPFVLSGVLGGGVIGDPVVAWVKKPGSPRWSYSSARLVYTAAGDWWYRYTPTLRGTYLFQARFAGNASIAPTTSPIVSVVVR